jgi:hypothetical protein
MTNTREDTFEIRKKYFIKLAIEIWRLRNSIEPLQDKKNSMIRHSILNIFSLFEKEGISFVDLKDQPYDAGMALEVIDVEENPHQLKGLNIIKEVIEPLILLNGHVINEGRVILEKGILEETPNVVNEGLNDKYN